MAKRIRELVAEYTAAVGEHADATAIHRAAELVAIAERARHVALVTGNANAALYAAESAACRAVEALGIPTARAPAAASFDTVIR